jgi:hypothetical protein
MKSKAIVLLLAAIMTLSMFYVQGGITAAAPAEDSTIAPTVQDEFIEKYAERLVDELDSADVMDPALREFMESGYLAEDVVTKADDSIKVILFLTPTADYAAVKAVVDVDWRMDLKATQVISASVTDALGLKLLEKIEGVSYISADTYLTSVDVEFDTTQPEMYEIVDVVGAMGTNARNYDGTGVIVGVDDDGTDFSLPDMRDAEYIDTDGNPGSYDPAGFGITEMVIANRTFVENTTHWTVDLGNLLTYESGGKYYLNVTGWDPVCNNDGSHRNLLGLAPPYGDGYPYGNTVGFIGLYEWAWGAENASEFVYNEMWMDWEIPAPGAENYTFGWAYQQRDFDYAKLFAPSMYYEGEIVIDWNGTLAWTLMWNYMTEHHVASADWLNFSVQADRDYITDMMDWSFADDEADGWTYGVGTGHETILSADIDNDATHDIGIGSLVWANDGFGLLPSTTDDFFCGIATDGLAWAAMYNSEGSHGLWTSSAVAARGDTDYPNIFTDGRTGTVNLPGVANQSKIIAVKGLTSGADLGAQFWAAGFHLDTDGNFTYSTAGQKHKADMVSNSWGYTNGAYLTLTYLTMAWDLLSAPGVIDGAYPGTLFLVSSGNSGGDYMSNGAPDSAFSVISVGGTIVTHAYNDLYEDNQKQLNQEAWFASNGPSFVGVVKPDIVAPSIFGQSPHAYHNWWLGNAYDSGASLWWSGTSLACPVAAGATALVLEAVRDHLSDANWYDPVILKNLMLSTASDIGVDPFIQGNGLVDVEAAIDAVLNGGGVLFESASWDNYEPIIEDAWDYWMPDDQSFDIWVDENQGPAGVESASIFFGNVYRSGSYDVDLTLMATDNFATTYLQGDFSSIAPWYYTELATYEYTVETRAHNDTNLYYVYRNDIVNITDTLSGPEMTAFLAANYVTITASSGDADVGLRVWDFEENNYGGSLGDVNATAGVVNYWYNSTYPGDYIQWVSRDTNNCNNLIARLSVPTGNTISSLFDYTPAIHLDDGTANETQGNEVTLSFTIWQKTTDTTISFADNTDNVTVTLDVPADAEYGIHQGSIRFDTGSWTHELPYSYMVVFEADGAEDEVMTLFDGIGAEQTPYENGYWAPNYDAAAGIRMDGGGHRTFVIEIPYDITINATTLVMRAEWTNPGTVVDLYLRETTYHLITQSNDGYGPPFAPVPTEDTTNTIVCDYGGLINGTYYLELGIHTYNGTFGYEDIKVTLQLYEELEDATVDPTWVSRTSTTPAVYAADDVLTGDHVEISNNWTLTTPTNLPEYAVTDTVLSFLSGLLYENTGTYVDGGVDDWPVPFDDATSYVWETVDGINEGDNVYVGMTSDADLSFDVYEWIDDDEDGEVDEDTELGATPFISVDDGGSGLEEGTFAAANDMSIAIRVFVWTYSYHAGDTYDITVDTRVSQDVESTDTDVSYDTYGFGRNITMTVIFTAYTDTDVVFEYNLGDVTFNNYFVPIVNITAPEGGDEYDGGIVNITWTVTDVNADDEHYFEVLVSADEGVTFQLLAKELTDTYYEWNCTPFLIRDTYVVQVRAYDNDTSMEPLGAETVDGYWPGLLGVDTSEVFSAGGTEETPITTPTTSETPEPTTSETPEPTDPYAILWIGLIGGIGIGVVVILILFLFKKK